MDTLQQVAAAMEDGALDTQKLVRALPESALNATMACEGGANSRNGYRERGLLTPAGRITLRIVSVNTFFTISTNVFSPIAPPLFRRPRQRGCAASG